MNVVTQDTQIVNVSLGERRYRGEEEIEEDDVV